MVLTITACFPARVTPPPTAETVASDPPRAVRNKLVGPAEPAALDAATQTRSISVANRETLCDAIRRVMVMMRQPYFKGSCAAGYLMAANSEFEDGGQTKDIATYRQWTAQGGTMNPPPPQSSQSSPFPSAPAYTGNVRVDAINQAAYFVLWSALAPTPYRYSNYSIEKRRGVLRTTILLTPGPDDGTTVVQVWLDSLEAPDWDDWWLAPYRTTDPKSYERFFFYLDAALTPPAKTP